MINPTEGVENISGIFGNDIGQVSQPTTLAKNVPIILDIKKKYPGLVLTSGMRTQDLNDTLEESVKHSKHLTGDAIDLRDNADGAKLYENFKLDKSKFPGIKKIIKHGNPVHYHVEFI